MNYKKFFLLFSAALIFAGCSTFPDLETISGNTALGIPQKSVLLIEKSGFSLGYSDKYRQALWVSYILDAERLRSKKAERKKSFLIDPQIKSFPVKPQEYSRSGFDRGHLAPAADMAYSERAMKESFMMSNISPQLPVCNRQNWLEVENLMRKWALREKRIYIITGPVFGNAERAFSSPPITVPTGFYKAVLDLTGPYKMIAFVVPNVNRRIRAEACVMSVDELEKITGYDFFCELDENMQNTLEKQCDLTAWEGE